MLSAEILDIQDIREADGTFLIPFNLELKWKDTRLSYKSLNNKTVLNTIEPSKMEDLWRPTVIFDNTNDKFRTIDPANDQERLSAMQVWGLHTYVPTHAYRLSHRSCRSL